MAGRTIAAKPSRRQHFIARFYLRNFGEPMFADNLCVDDLQKRRWEKRTPDGVGWSKRLRSMIETDGTRTDDFDKYLKLQVEDPAAPALKKLATGGALDSVERAAAALFIAITARTFPELNERRSRDPLGGAGGRRSCRVGHSCEKLVRAHGQPT